MTRLASSARSKRRRKSRSASHDIVTSTRFVEPFRSGIKNSELVIFEMCAHAPIYENVSEFNEKTLAFLKRHIG